MVICISSKRKIPLTKRFINIRYKNNYYDYIKNISKIIIMILIIILLIILLILFYIINKYILSLYIKIDNIADKYIEDFINHT
jgi:hypothetical protein